MPFQSQAQWNWAFATNQPWARDWAKHTPGGKRRYALLRRRVSKKAKNIPSNPILWKRAIAQAKRKFDVYPSAYANAWASRWYAQRGGTWSSESKDAYKHLPGQHNQQAHGRSGRGGGGAGGSKTVAQFNAWNEREIAKIEDTILNISNRKPYSLSANDRDRIHQIIAKTHPKARFDVIDSFITYNASRGLTPDEIILSGVNVPAVSGGIGLRDISEQPFVNALIRQHYNEQRIRISNMDADTQEQILDGIKSKTDRTSWDYDTVAGLSIYANPQTRWESIQLLMNDDNSKNPRTLSNGTKLIDTTQNHELNTARDVMQYYSMDYRLYSAMYAANGYSTPEYGVTPKGQEDQAFNDFMGEFTNTHTSQNTNNVLGAQIQQAVSMVGPNAGGKYPSFYPRGVKPPEPNPEVIRLLNEQYQATQQRYANWGVSEIPLYRGQNPDFAMGIPMGPWSDDQSVAVRFALQHQNGIFNTATMPVKYILMDYNDVNFRTQYKESEYLVTENAFVRNSRRKKIGQKPKTTANGSQVYLQDVAWTEKAFQELPPTSSYLEQDYDIFYNYRTDDKQSARRKRREKAYRHKADFEARGNAPGRRWSAGSGEVITGNLGRDASGRFVNVSGSRAVSSAVETIARAQRQNAKKPKQPKQSAEQRAQQRQQERARAGESGMQELGYSKEQYAILATIRGNPQPVGESIDESTQSLIDAGFAEIIDGNVVTTSLGKKVLSSVESGSLGDAQEAIIRDQEKRREQADKRQERVDSLEEKIAGIEDRLDSLKPRSRAVAERRLARYRAKLTELQTSEKYKHLPGKHNQRAHGNNTARRSAYQSAYRKVRAGGGSVQDARAAARDASQQELQNKLEQRRVDRTAKRELIEAQSRITTVAERPFTPELRAEIQAVYQNKRASGDMYTPQEARALDSVVALEGLSVSDAVQRVDSLRAQIADGRKQYDDLNAQANTIRSQVAAINPDFEQSMVPIVQTIISVSNSSTSSSEMQSAMQSALPDLTPSQIDKAVQVAEQYQVQKRAQRESPKYVISETDYTGNKHADYEKLVRAPSVLRGSVENQRTRILAYELAYDIVSRSTPPPTGKRRKSTTGYTPPADVRAAAARGLELRREFNRGGTAVGVARARDLSNGKSISLQTIRRMVSYFARHAVDKRPDWSNPSDPTPGYIAWMLWGGDAGKRWANAINARMSTREKHLPGQHDQRSHGRNTPRRQAYRAAYQKARSEGSSPEEARAMARGVSREIFRKELEQRRAERAANRKVKPKPPVVQPESTPTIPSVLDNSFKSLTPDQQAEVAINHFQNAPGYIELVREEKRLKDERNRIVSEYNSQQKQKTVNPADVISRETAEEIIKQYADVVKKLNDRETELFHQVLEQLQVDNPTTISVSYKGKMTKSVRARVERTMQLVSGMFPQTSQRGDIQIELRNSETRGRFRGSAKPSVGPITKYQVSSVRDPQTGAWITNRVPITIPAQPDRVTGEIKGNASDSRLMIHESLHVFQHSTQALRDPCHDFAIQRTQGENAQYLSVLMNNAGYGQETAYKDAVDNPYTLKTYAGNYGWDRGFYDSSYATPFMEVLTMGFESMADPDIQDRGPLVAALTAIKAAQQK